jgi:hypothetical protein
MPEKDKGHHKDKGKTTQDNSESCFFFKTAKRLPQQFSSSSM